VSKPTKILISQGL